MGVRINTNIEALNAQRNLASTAISFGKSIEKLSSGLRINRAGDDAAGLSISEKLRAQVKGLTQATRNAQDGISMIQTAEGALNETHSILQRMRELGVEASNDTLSDADRKSVGDELQALQSEINRISTDTKFNGKVLLNGSLSTTLAAGSGVKDGLTVAGTSVVVSKVEVSGATAGTTYAATAAAGNLTLTGGGKTQTLAVAAMTTAGVQELNFSQLGIKISITGGGNAGDTAANIATGFQTAANVTTGAGSGNAQFLIGAEAGQTMSVGFAKIDTSAASLALDAAITTYTGATNTANAQSLITAIDAAISKVSDQRGALGAAQNRLEHTVANLGVSAENLSTSESRIRDADLASETVSFTKTQILQQAGTAILAQANQAPNGVLSLLR